MIRLWQRLLDPAYLYAIDPGPLGRWKWIYYAWAVLLIAGAGAALWWGRRSSERAERGAAYAALAACAAGLGFLGLRFLTPWSGRLPDFCRFLLVDAWTARVWPLSATLAALLALPVGLAARRRLPVFVQRQVDALCGALQARDAALPVWQQGSLLVVHLLGLTGLWYQADRPAWWAVPTLAVLCALPLLARPHRPRLETLTPLLPAYLGGVLWAVLRRLDIDPGAYAAYALPDPLSPWFDVPALLLAGGAYVLWIQARLVVARRRWVLALVTTAAVLGWLVAVVAVHRTHGVTASDPYCYLQMAIDLAESGSAQHTFPLAGLARDLALPTWPAVPIGYHPPDLENRAATMWPIGWPLLMVPFYRLGGLELAYLAAPAMAVLALAVTWLTAWEALRGSSRDVRHAVAALTCLLVATSPEGSERILVPMADAAAQLFTMASLWLLLRARRGRPLLYGLLAGAALGAAYLVRHPQLPLAAAALAAAAAISPADRGSAAGSGWLGRPLYRRMGLLAAFGLGALALAVPDLIYHARAFGHWLHTESSEWFLISIRFAGRSLFGVLEQGLLRREELGFVAPLALYGAWRLWRRQRPGALILGTGTGAVLLFHLLYAALRPRDLIAILPVFYLCAAYGLVSLGRHMMRRRTPGAALLLFCMALLVGVRSERVLAMPWREDVITFGHVTTAQRRALATLAEQTPENAVIGSMLNSGAIELHARRGAVHPAPWTEAELYAWIEALQARGRDFYVLDDGEEMVAVLARIEARYTLRRIQALELPYFALGGGNLPRQAVLYRVE